MEHIKSFIREDEGQDVVEYGLLIATIALIVLVGTGLFGDSINTWFGNLSSKIVTAGGV